MIFVGNLISFICFIFSISYKVFFVVCFCSCLSMFLSCIYVGRFGYIMYLIGRQIDDSVIDFGIFNDGLLLFVCDDRLFGGHSCCDGCVTGAIGHWRFLCDCTGGHGGGLFDRCSALRGSSSTGGSGRCRRTRRQWFACITVGGCCSHCDWSCADGTLCGQANDGVR